MKKSIFKFEMHFKVWLKTLKIGKGKDEKWCKSGQQLKVNFPVLDLSVQII